MSGKTKKEKINKKFYHKELSILQVELTKLQRWIQDKNQKVVVILILLLAVSPVVYGAKKFDEIASAIKNKAPKMELERLEKKYMDFRIKGWGYIISVTKDISDYTIVNLSTKAGGFIKLDPY